MTNIQIIEGLMKEASKELQKTEEMPLLIISQDKEGNTMLHALHEHLTPDILRQIFQMFLQEIEKRNRIISPGNGMTGLVKNINFIKGK